MALEVGILVYDGIDQADVTGPFEVLSRLSDARCRLYAPEDRPVRDVNGLRLLPDAVLEDAPQLGLLHVPDGPGQESLMDDERVLGWLRRQAAGAEYVLSVCTGALLLGAAGELRGRRATTHWASAHLLPYFGAERVDERVVRDGKFVFAGGVTSGIDGALHVAAALRGDDEARSIQLWMQYAPEPPFDAGTPETAPPELVERARAGAATATRAREETARRVAARLGV